MNYDVVIHTAEEGGFWAEVPALAGCYTQGESIEEVLTNAVDAIETHLDALKDDGMKLPSPDSVRIETVSVSAA
jgi:predicted RNase H-like HicB family nuclease